MILMEETKDNYLDVRRTLAYASMNFVPLLASGLEAMEVEDTDSNRDALMFELVKRDVTTYNDGPSALFALACYDSELADWLMTNNGEDTTKWECPHRVVSDSLLSTVTGQKVDLVKYAESLNRDLGAYLDTIFSGSSRMCTTQIYGYLANTLPTELQLKVMPITFDRHPIFNKTFTAKESTDG